MVCGNDKTLSIAQSIRRRSLITVLGTATCCFLVLDQSGKGWAFAPWRQPPVPLEILPGLFVGAQGRNNGGMFSLEGTGSAMIVWIFTAIVFILLGMVLRWAIVLDRDRWRPIDAVAGGLLLAGILGNQLDRMILGFVRDYIILARFPYNIFNTADLFMLLGAFILVASLFIRRRPAGLECLAA
jgi:signal peptidase II